MLQEQFHSALVHILISVILYPKGSKGTLPVHKACLLSHLQPCHKGLEARLVTEFDVIKKKIL